MEDSNVTYPILPVWDKPGDYHQKLQWRIGDLDWYGYHNIYLQLGTKIPGSYSYSGGKSPPGWKAPFVGGFVRVAKDFIGFTTRWPKEVDHEKVCLSAVFSIKIDDTKAVKITCDETRRIVHATKNAKTVRIGKAVKITPYEDIFVVDVGDKFEKYFTLEAELKVTHSDDIATGHVNDEKPSKFKKDMATIFNDEKNSDVEVIVGGESFHCHKNVLSARSEVFKNMLGPDTLETQTDTIEMKEVGAEAVKSLLKHIYSGEIPRDPELLSPDLLHIADMYLLDPLKEACLESLVQRMKVSSSISTFILVDRYESNGGKLREMVIMFMKCKVGEVMELDDWKMMEEDHPFVSRELLNLAAKSKLRSKEKHRHKSCQFCVVSYQ